MAKQVDAVYGGALFQEASEKGIISQVYHDIKILRPLFREKEQLMNFLEHPAVEKSKKTELLKSSLKGRVTDEVLSFLECILDHGRQDKIPEIFKKYLELARNTLGIGRAYVTSAQELNSRQQEQVRKRLLEVTSYQEMEIKFKADPSILGGLIIRLGNQVLDGSIKNRLKEMEQAAAFGNHT